MRVFLIIGLLLLLHRHAVPLILRKKERATTVLKTPRVRWLLMVGEHEPPLLYYIFSALFPALFSSGGYKQPGLVGHYVVQTAPAPDESLAEFADKELWHQDYYRLNLLNRRSLTLIRQRHLAASEIRNTYYKAKRIR